jgi:hypothetical protein
MTLEEILERIEELPDVQIKAIEKYLRIRRDKIEEEIIMERIREQLKNAPREITQKATKPFDIDTWNSFAEEVRKELSEEEIDELVEMMTGKPAKR